MSEIVLVHLSGTQIFSMKKFLLSILIVLILVGLFAPIGRVRAQAEPLGTCNNNVGKAPVTGVSELQCTNIAKLNPADGWTWTPDGTTGTPSQTGPQNVPLQITSNAANPSEFERQVGQTVCFNLAAGFSLQGCILKFLYITLFQLGGFLLYVCGYFFNIMMSATLDGTLLQSPFVREGWGIVRDLSNLFFILILLYIAITIILDLGGHGAKKMIANVVIMALLINFSMFMTEIVIDTSNILALIFYNKIDTKKEVNGQLVSTAYTPISSKKEPDLSGGLVDAFDPTKLISNEFFEVAKTIPMPGILKSAANPVPPALLIAMTVMAGVIMIFAAYALFISAVSFLGRLIELFVLIIFSPFAFMSFALPILGHVEYIGWDQWLKRLFKVAFMAPIFMFFLFFIFKLVHANIFSSFLQKGQGPITFILGIILPAMLILILLMRATKYAKEGSGTVGEVLMKGANIAAGLAVGAGAIGAAGLLRGTVGRAGAAVAESKFAKSTAVGRFVGKGAKAVGTRSFDIRGAKVGGVTLASATGFKVGEAQKGGFIEARKKSVEAKVKRAKELEVGEDDVLKKNLNKLEMDKQELLRIYSHDIEILDRDMENARKKSNDLRLIAQADPTNTTKQDEYKRATEVLRDIRDEKTALKNGDLSYARRTRGGGSVFFTSDGTMTGRQNNRTRDGNHSINDMEDNIIPHAHGEIERENRRRKWKYANTVQGRFFSTKTAREAAHKIRMEAKLDSGNKH
jgi:hypothetical protein